MTWTIVEAASEEEARGVSGNYDGPIEKLEVRERVPRVIWEESYSPDSRRD